MTEIIRLKATDFEEAMDFMNMVFSMSGGPTDFTRLLHKLYQPADQLMNCNYAIRRSGKIRSVVGSFPMILKAGGCDLLTAGIGGVSTHPDERRSGLMRQLMEAALTDMKEQGYALSVLGGQRQRYGYYGYERGGSCFNYSLSKTNLRHVLHGEPASIQFTCLAAPENASIKADPKYEPAEARDQVLKLMSHWHASQPVRVDRDQYGFLETVRSWYASVWLAADEHDRLVGYLIVNTDGTVSEMITSSPEWNKPLAAAWVMKQPADRVTFKVQPSQIELARELAQICEHWQIEQAYMYCILDWPLVLQALLQAKASMVCLPEGQFSIRLADLDQIVQLSLSNGKAAAKLVDTSPDIVLDSLTATRLFLGPLAAEYVLPAEKLENSNTAFLLASWLPLPLGWPGPDEV